MITLDTKLIITAQQGTNINRSGFRSYFNSGWQPIPLHRVTDKSKDKSGRLRSKGKRPLHTNWTRKKYGPRKTIERCIADGRNMGIRLTDRQLVIDVDPRNGGTEGFHQLCKDRGLNPAEYPRVQTGSGGSHYYLRLPKGIRVRDTLKNYPGVEFKSAGRQVVAAGSRHPDTGELYAWDGQGHPPLAEAPMAPVALVAAIRRPDRLGGAATEGGQCTPHQIATALTGLDVLKFRDQDAWLKVMMACHHASAGEARQEFIDWSTSDPEYKDDAERIGRRWDSLDPKRKRGLTFRTLNKILVEAGKQHLQIRPNVADAITDFDDFDASEFEPDSANDDSEFEGSEGDDSASNALEDLSRTFCTVVDGSFRVMYLDESPEMPGRRYWKSISDKAFCAHYSNKRIEVDGKSIQLGKAWIEWPGRPSAVGVIFDPSNSPADDIESRIIDGRLNLWTGYGCAPVQKEDGWALLNAMIRDDLCGGNETVHVYVIKWMAYKIQNPGLPCDTSIVFKGPKGIGKTTLGELLVDIFGSHGLVVSRRSQFAGQFSGHLATACFVFADEAVWGGNKEDEGTLKKLITDRHVLYRAMYKEEAYGVNRVGLMMATNEDWAVPATFDERRFVVPDVSDRHRVTGPQDIENRAYWDAIRNEISNGGREAFFHDMLHMDLGDWTPRVGAPRTAALSDQIREGLRGVDRWYYEMLTESSLPCDDGEDGPDWNESGHQLSYRLLLTDCREWMHRNRQAATISARGLAKKLKPLGWKAWRTMSDRGLVAPSRTEAVAIYEKHSGGKLFA